MPAVLLCLPPYLSSTSLLGLSLPSSLLSYKCKSVSNARCPSLSPCLSLFHLYPWLLPPYFPTSFPPFFPSFLPLTLSLLIFYVHSIYILFFAITFHRIFWYNIWLDCCVCKRWKCCAKSRFSSRLQQNHMDSYCTSGKIYSQSRKCDYMYVGLQVHHEC